MTHKLLSEIMSVAQISLLSTSSISRIMNTVATRSGNFEQAIAHRFPKFIAMHHFIWFRFPFLWAVHVHPVSFRHEFLRAFVVEKFQVGERRFASTFSVVVADFVLQDSAKPTAHCRSPAKTVMCSHPGKERLLNQVLCDVGLAYTLEGIAIENVSMLIDPAFGIGRSESGCPAFDWRVVSWPRRQSLPAETTCRPFTRS